MVCESEKARYVGLLRRCKSAQALEEGKRIHAQIVQAGYERDKFLNNILLQLYGHCAALPDARQLFTKSHIRDAYTWNFMIGSCIQHGHEQEALQLFQGMHIESILPDKCTLIRIPYACKSAHDGRRIHASIVGGPFEPDIAVGTALVSMYVSCGLLEDAHALFENCHGRDVVCWTALITAYAQMGAINEAFQLFHGMLLENVMPNQFTYASILSACANRAALFGGKCVHAHIAASCFEMDGIVKNSLVTMYSKCGRVKEAWKVFNVMMTKDVVSWTAMIAAYAHHGGVKEALKLFQEMQAQGIVPNEVTMGSILAVCSHAGLLEEGKHYFYFMQEAYGIKPTVEHYSCMLDLLGKTGQLGEVENMIKSLPSQVSGKLWAGLLGACKIHSDAKRAEYAANRCFELEPENDAPYVLLSNIYTAEGRWEDAETVREGMQAKGLKKQPGYSSIEVNNSLHDFFANDDIHSQKHEIYAELVRLDTHIKAAGYVPETKLVLHEVGEQEKENMLMHHSEKMAIAFGLISTPPGASLCVTKNLRVCSDCHSYMKFISKMTNREICFRDLHRFHHFRDGICSCLDYW